MANFLNGHSLETGPVKEEKKKTVFQISYSYTPMPIYGSKFQNLGGSKKFDKDFGKWNLQTQSPTRRPQGVTPPPKMVPPYTLGTCPPTTPRHFDTPSLLHRENIDFLKTPDFGQSIQTALKSPKIDICQN